MGTLLSKTNLTFTSLIMLQEWLIDGLLFHKEEYYAWSNRALRGIHIYHDLEKFYALNVNFEINEKCLCSVF